jgi:hypothetical protein
MADNLPPSRANVMESGCIKLSEPSGANGPVMGLLYIYLLLYVLSVIMIEYTINNTEICYLENRIGIQFAVLHTPNKRQIPNIALDSTSS